MRLYGNEEKFNLENIATDCNSVLREFKMVFLGSSVTLGETSGHISFADYIAKRNNIKYIKEAVSGTTLVDTDRSSYISRLKNIDKSFDASLFVIQLSTNDASYKLDLGDIDETNTKTIFGAINYIIDYVLKNWNAKIVFYTNPFYKNDYYLSMVEGLKKIQSTRNIYLIDLYTDMDFNNISSQERELYMVDDIHPSKAGYLLWWTPFFEKKLIEIVKE